MVMREKALEGLAKTAAIKISGEFWVLSSATCLYKLVDWHGPVLGRSPLRNVAFVFSVNNAVITVCLLISLFGYHGWSQIALTEIPEGDLERLTKSAVQENIICSADDLFLLLFDQSLWWKTK